MCGHYAIFTSQAVNPFFDEPIPCLDIGERIRSHNLLMHL
ncbi:Uncharacterised protein [Bacillus freudenreichii]|nr:Uncharacterised protein [Bacillus freudenreichii]